MLTCQKVNPMDGEVGSLLFLGTGTSHGVPEIACNCEVCTSTDPLDKRNRCCALLKCPNGENVLFDCGPELRIQLTHAHIKKVDYVLITHGHADHINGLDDLRVFGKVRPLKIYMDIRTRHEIFERFDYAFPETSSKKDCVFRFEAHTVEESPFKVGSYEFIPIPLYHGRLKTTGYRIGNFAYLTDVNYIPESSYKLLEGVEIIAIDALNVSDHPTHFSLVDAFRAVVSIRPKKAYFIHMDSLQNTRDNQEFIADLYRKYPESEGIEVQLASDYLEIGGIIFR